MNSASRSEGLAAVRRLSVARLISFSGSVASQTALIFTVLEQTESALLVSAAVAGTIGMSGLLMPLFGALADRVDRKRLMIASDVVAAIIYAAIVPFTDEIAPLLILAAAAGIAELAFLPASQAAIPALVGDKSLLDRANAWSVGARSGGLLLGPLLGGGLFELAGPGAVFAVNAVSFAVSAILVAGIHRPFREGIEAVKIPIRNAARALGVGAKEGFQIAWRDADLRRVILAESVAFAALGWVWVAEAPLANLFNAGALGYGLITTIWGLGMTLAAAPIGRLNSTGREREWLAASYAFVAISFLLTGLAPWFALVLVLSFVGGIGDSSSDVFRASLVQRRTVDSVRGSVLAAMEGVGGIAIFLSVVMAGPVIDLIGVRATYVVGGGCFALAIIPLLYRSAPQLRRAEYGQQQ